MSAEIKNAFADDSVELIAGSGGIFEVTLDGTLVYSKRDTGRFPNDGEIADLG